MVEELEEKSQESQSENVPWQPLPQDDAYFPYTSQPQNEAAAEVEESMDTKEKHEEIRSKFNEFMKAISEETSQLTDFVLEEKKLIKELCSLSTQILKNLKISFNIHPDCISKLREARQIKFNKEGYLTIIRNDDTVDSKLLEDYPPDTILAVMMVIIPELEKAIKTYRKNRSHRVSLLEKIKHELKNLQKAVSPDEKELYEMLQDEELRKPVIASEG